MNLLSFLTPIEIAKFNSSINGEIKVVESFGKRTLYANGLEQSGGTIVGMWGKSISNIKNQKLKISDCLVLGLGGGTVISLLRKYYSNLNITVVEIDPVMIEVAKKYFGLEKFNQLKIINQDAVSWIKNHKIKFDLIIFDLYVEKFNPPKSRTLSFLKDLSEVLKSKGIILFNSHYQNDEKDLEKMVDLCHKVYNKVALILSYPYSRILLLGK